MQHNFASFLGLVVVAAGVGAAAAWNITNHVVQDVVDARLAVIQAETPRFVVFDVAATSREIAETYAPEEINARLTEIALQAQRLADQGYIVLTTDGVMASPKGIAFTPTLGESSGAPR